MRVFLLGCLILGLAVVVLPWDASDDIGKPGRPLDAPTPDGASTIAPPTAPAPAHALEQERTAAQISAPAATTAIGPAAASSQRATNAVANPARQVAPATPPGVRDLGPGSKAYSEAIASNITSEKFQDVASPLARLYLAYFNRPPDYEGFDYYIGERDRGEPLDAIAEEFAGSLEFDQRYGSLDNASFVDRAFRNVFGGLGAAAQRDYWIAQLESGSMTRGQVMLAFSESPAFRAVTGNEVFVAMAYAETLGRAPDPADFARWVGFLDAGNPRRAVIDGLLADRGKR